MQRFKYSTVLKLFSVLVWGCFFLPLSLRAQQPQSTGAAPADSSLLKDTRLQKGITVSGRILDASTKAGLSGINVSVAGFSAAITNDRGRFHIRVPSLNFSLTVSAEGYQEKEVALKGRHDITILLYQEPFQSVYDGAVLPFGDRAASATPYALATLDMHDKWRQPIGESADDYLQGQVAGLNAVRRSGTPGSGAYLSIRGFNSLLATNQPLIVVDGMPYDYTQYGTSLITGHFNDPLSNIDLKDIDNITVIKDGTSTYGTRGANGVILITTSRAKELATRIDFAAYGGFNIMPTLLPVMDASSYRIYLTELLQSGGFSNDSIQKQPYMIDQANPEYYAYHNNTRWQKQIFHNSYNQNYYLKVTGGDNIASYALSLGYLKNAGILENTDLTRSETRFNADLNLSPKLKAAVNLSFVSNQQNLMNQGPASQTNPIYISQTKSPFMAVHDYDENGVISPNLADYDVFNVSNPVSLINNMQAQDKNYRFFGSVKFQYLISRSFRLETLLGVTFDKVKEDIFIPDAGVVSDTLSKAVATNKSGSRTQRLYTLYNDTHLAWERTFGYIHHLEATAGFRYSNSKTEDEQGIDYNSATDEFVSVGMGSAALRSISGGIGHWNWLNNYLHVGYNLLDKYFLTGDLTADGSSRFGVRAPGGIGFNHNRYAVNPSAAAAWLISSEKFMAGAGFITMLKLRASYGRVGNDDIGNYASRQYYTSQNLLGMQGLVRGSIGNPRLQWEEVTKADFGIDASLFHERLTVSMDLYRDHTSRLVTPDSLSTATGFAYISVNNGSMRTTGMDGSLQARILNGPLKWDLGIRLGFYRNKITALPSQRMLSTYGGATYLTQPGREANLFYGYKTQGVFASDAEAAASGLTNVKSDGTVAPFRGGDIRFVDENNDHLIDSRDQVVIGNPNPKLSGGISTGLSWRNWSAEALFTFSEGNDIYNYDRAQLESMKGFENQSVAVVNRWKAEGQQTSIPRAAWGDPSGNARFSDRWIEKGSYLRLRTASLSYNLPVKASALKYIKIYATGNNLVTWSRYLGYDPEFAASNSLFAQGIDFGMEPEFSSVQLGIRLGF